MWSFFWSGLIQVSLPSNCGDTGHVRVTGKPGGRREEFPDALHLLPRWTLATTREPVSTRGFQLNRRPHSHFSRFPVPSSCSGVLSRVAHDIVSVAPRAPWDLDHFSDRPDLWRPWQFQGGRARYPGDHPLAGSGCRLSVGAPGALGRGGGTPVRRHRRPVQARALATAGLRRPR